MAMYRSFFLIFVRKQLTICLKMQGGFATFLNRALILFLKEVKFTTNKKKKEEVILLLEKHSRLK